MEHVKAVQKSVIAKSKAAAEYFCDKRQNAVFIVKVFKEMLQFVNEFLDTTQVRELWKFYLPTLGNPFEAAFKKEQQLQPPTSPMASLQYFTPPASLATIPSMNEDKDQSMTLASAGRRHSPVKQRPAPNHQISHVAQSQYKSHLPVPPSYHHSHSVADKPSNIFGSNLADIQRILWNMTEYIKKDILY